MRAISISTGVALALAALALFSLGVMLNSQSRRAQQLKDSVGGRHVPLKRAAGMQQREAQVQKTLAEILDVTQRRGRCNLLIFGFGYDPSFWSYANPNGTTAFLEDSQERIDRIIMRHVGRPLTVHKVQYTTQMKRDEKKFQNSSNWPSLQMQLPAQVLSTSWDVIIVDAPRGFGSHPGRWQSIYMAAHLKRPPNSLTVVDDCERPLESSFANAIFGRERLEERIGRPRSKLVKDNQQCYYRDQPGGLVRDAAETKKGSKEAAATRNMIIMLAPNASGKEARAKKLKKKYTSDSKKDTEITQWLEKVLKSFEGSGQGGGGTLDSKTLQKLLGDPLVYDVRNHLQAFTGLSSAELDRRLARADKHHFEVGHAFADPKSATELAWFYSTSSEYLFANAVHPALNLGLTPADGPVLDYSAGVGNTVILLASQGIPCIYFGIGLIESAFAEYRIRRLGLQHLVTFLKPHDMSTNWGFDPRNVLKNDTYGTILAMDVLEHIPKWEETVRAMVHSLRPGGRIFEHTPFSRDSPRTPVDLRVHVGRGTLSMSEAMGPQMKFLNSIGTGTNVGTNVWRKARSV
jgi:uncharacterized protein (TIGR01627 family)